MQGGGSSSSPAKLSNGVKEGSSGTKSKETKREGKEKAKVSKPPPETKRPPRLLATPCPYLQTASIYGSPQSELTKAREARTAPGATPQEAVMDLSSSSAGYKAGAPSAPRPPPLERKEAPSPARGLTITRPPSAAPGERFRRDIA